MRKEPFFFLHTRLGQVIILKLISSLVKKNIIMRFSKIFGAKVNEYDLHVG